MKFSLAGKSVLGIDVNHKKCQLLNSGHSTLSHIDDSIFSKILKKDLLPRQNMNTYQVVR